MTTIDLHALLAAFGRTTLQNMQQAERIAELEESVARLVRENAHLVSSRQNYVTTDREIAEELVPQDIAKEETVRIVRRP